MPRGPVHRPVSTGKFSSPTRFSPLQHQGVSPLQHPSLSFPPSPSNPSPQIPTFERFLKKKKSQGVVRPDRDKTDKRFLVS